MDEGTWTALRGRPSFDVAEGFNFTLDLELGRLHGALRKGAKENV